MTDDAPAAVRRIDRGRLRAVARASCALALLLAAVSIEVKPELLLPSGKIFVPFVPIPFALVALRYGTWPAWAATVGSAIAGFAFALHQGLVDAISVAFLYAWLGGITALVVYGCRQGGRFEKLPLLAVTAAYLVATTTALGYVAWATGVDGIGRPVVRSAQLAHDQAERDCRRAGGDEESIECRNLEQRKDVLAQAKRSGAHWAAALAMFSTIAFGAITLWLTRTIAVSYGMGMAPPRAFRDFSLHWSAAYAIAAGIVVYVGAREMRGPLADEAEVLATGLLALVLAMLVIQGTAVLAFLFGAWQARRWVQVVVFAGLVLMNVVGAFVLGAIGVFEMMFGIRNRVRGRIPPNPGSRA